MTSVCTYGMYVFSNNIISSLLQALHQFISEYQLNSDEGENIDLAIQTVGEAQKEPLTKKLIEYLMGETDDCPKVWICTVYTYIRMYCMCVCRYIRTYLCCHDICIDMTTCYNPRYA